jgi:NAD(P)-dependent dehydrogenase (short-subunit alcohol dehydrogenase family)
MSEHELAGATALVTGASRGFGRGIATALTRAGAQVIGVARERDRLNELRAQLGESFIPVSADAADPVVAGQLIDAYRPTIMVLNAGATPLVRPLHQHTWETFSANWQTDVRIAFHWLREALLKPLPPGSRVVVMSSGAALAGSPLSGGYAGAKATLRFITGYAQDEANRAGLGITFTAVLPRITSLTDLGRPAVQAYAARAGQSEQEYIQQQGGALTPEQVGQAVTDLVTGRAPESQDRDAYLLAAAGLRPLP